MLRVLGRVMDAIWAGLVLLRDLLADLTVEILIWLTACGLLAVTWWGFHTAPYPTASIAAGTVLFAGYGAIAYLREMRGAKLAGRLGTAGLVTAAVVGLMAAYLPSCACLE